MDSMYYGIYNKNYGLASFVTIVFLTVYAFIRSEL